MIDVATFNAEVPAGRAWPTDRFPWHDDLLACERCACRKEARQVVPGWGRHAGIPVMVVGQNPGEDEDREGRPFSGRSGRMLDDWLSRLRIDRRRLYVTNIVKCHTTKNRKPKVKEIRACATAWLDQEIAGLPALRVIFLLGQPAMLAFDEKLGMEDAFRPTFILAKHLGTDRVVHLIPLPHPAYFLRVASKLAEFESRVLPTISAWFRRVQGDVYDQIRSEG